MQGWEEDFKNLVADLNIAIEGITPFLVRTQWH